MSETIDLGAFGSSLGMLTPRNAKKQVFSAAKSAGMAKALAAYKQGVSVTLADRRPPTPPPEPAFEPAPEMMMYEGTPELSGTDKLMQKMPLIIAGVGAAAAIGILVFAKR